MESTARKRKVKRESIDTTNNTPRYFLNPDSVSKHLYCSICQDVFCQPQRAPCGHSFCKKCISLWLKSNNTCPEDRLPLRIEQLHHDFILENIVGDQKVVCPYRSSGCDSIVPLHLLTSHAKSCCFNPCNQPEFLRRRVLTDVTYKEHSQDSTSGVMPSPGKPSLMLRLIKGDDSKKNLLKMMFDEDQSS